MHKGHYSSCWTNWRWEGGVRLATVRETKTMNSFTLDLWKYPKWLTSNACAKITGSDPSGLHFSTANAVIFISLSLSLLQVWMLIAVKSSYLDWLSWYEVNSVGYEVFLLLLQFLNVICSVEIGF